MRIGIDCRFYGTGFTGIGRYTAELVRHLAELDRETEYVCFFNEPEFSRFTPPGPNFRAVRINAKHYSVAEQTSFLVALQKEKFDLVHFTHFNAPLLYTRPSVVTIHDLTLSFYPGQKYGLVHRLAYELVVRRSVAHARQIIAVSENTKRDLTRLLKTPEDKITVVYNGIGNDFYPAENVAAIRESLAQKYSLTRPYALYTGVWRDHKNVLGLIRAFGKFLNSSLPPFGKGGGRRPGGLGVATNQDDNGNGFRNTQIQNSAQPLLVITGKPDPVYAPAIYELVEELSLKNDVIFPGLVPEADLLALYQAAHMFVFPSFYEGFGLPLLEAMAAGVPVVSSKSSCLPEIAGEKNAVFFDPANADEMAAAIAKVWNDDALRADLIARGLQRVQEFSWEKMARETLAVYRQALA